MREHSYRLSDSPSLTAFMREAAKVSGDVWFRMLVYENQPLHLLMRVPDGFDIEPLDQIALRCGLMPNSN